MPPLYPSIEGQITRTLGPEDRFRLYPEAAKIILVSHHFGLRDAANQVCLHILRFRIGSIINIAADIQVIVVFSRDLVLVDEAAVFGELKLPGKDEIYLLYVFRPELVLCLSLGVLAVGIDEQHLILQAVGLVLVADQHACWDAGPVKQARRQAYDRLYHVVIDEEFADELFLASPEEYAVGHDRCHMAASLEAGQHMLHEHQIRLLACLGAPFPEAAGEFHVRT